MHKQSLKEEGEDVVDQESQESKLNGGVSTDKESIERTDIELAAQLEDVNSKYLYAMAEIDNTRKRHIKERSDLLKYSGENIARDLLEILDDLDRASGQSQDVPAGTVIEGIGLIANRMRSLYERHGIKSEECVGHSFDPKKHEALTMVPSSKEDSGKVLQQISKCYFFKDKLLRPGQVIVGNGEMASADEVAVEFEGKN